MVNSTLFKAVESLIAESTGEPVSGIASARPVSGGCINDAQQIQLSDGRRYFLKSNSTSPAKMFHCEAKGLKELANVDEIRVPDVVGMGSVEGTSFLVLELIESTSPQPDFSQAMGRQLALLHLNSTSDRFGFSDANFLGSTIQPNEWKHNWIEFWAEQRLGFQLQLAQDGGVGDQQLQRLGKNLISRLEDRLFSVPEPPSLLHGDLWSGNYMSGPTGEPVLMDPAVYFGHREAEFGMTTLFGGFDADFYDAYNEASPMADQASDRIAIYRLYHLLNHLNLFGGSYLGGCLEILKKYA